MKVSILRIMFRPLHWVKGRGFHIRAQFPDYPIKKIRLDNAEEFTSQAFDNYCMSIGIDVKYPVAHTYTQNGLAESFIKRFASESLDSSSLLSERTRAEVCMAVGLG